LKNFNTNIDSLRGPIELEMVQIGENDRDQTILPTNNDEDDRLVGDDEPLLQSTRSTSSPSSIRRTKRKSKKILSYLTKFVLVGCPG
jgi:hypothetical protein